jgi:hypothetical protein
MREAAGACRWHQAGGRGSKWPRRHRLERIPHATAPNRRDFSYLTTKASRSGHLLQGWHD